MENANSTIRGRLFALITLFFFATASSGAPKLSCSTVRIVDAYPSGGSTDLIARYVAKSLSERISKPVIVESRPGAGGSIGATFVAKSPPDGCVLMIATDATHAGNYHLVKNPPYHPINDFTPISLAIRNILVMVAHSSQPAKNVAELVKQIGRDGGELVISIPGIGSPHHLAAEMFAEKTGIKIQNIPFNGGAPAVMSVVGNQTPFGFASLSVALPYIKDGRLKALAIAESRRFPGLPDVPTFSETMPGFGMSSWMGFVGPANLDDSMVDLVRETSISIFSQPDIVRRLSDLGYVIVNSTPREFADVMGQDFKIRGEMLRRRGISTER